MEEKQRIKRLKRFVEPDTAKKTISIWVNSDETVDFLNMLRSCLQNTADELLGKMNSAQNFFTIKRNVEEVLSKKHPGVVTSFSNLQRYFLNSHDPLVKRRNKAHFEEVYNDENGVSHAKLVFEKPTTWYRTTKHLNLNSTTLTGKRIYQAKVADVSNPNAQAYVKFKNDVAEALKTQKMKMRKNCIKCWGEFSKSWRVR